MRSCNTTNPPCPHVYNSTDAYKYKSCYNFRIDSENKQNWSSESNSTRPLLILQNNPVEAGSEVWEMIFPLSIGVVCFVLVISLLAFVVYRRRIKQTCKDSQTGDTDERSTFVNHVHNSNLKWGRKMNMVWARYTNLVKVEWLLVNQNRKWCIYYMYHYVLNINVYHIHYVCIILFITDTRNRKYMILSLSFLCVLLLKLVLYVYWYIE